MIANSESIDDKIRTSKHVSFGWSELPCKEHRDFTGVPCNNFGAFYPRQNRSHYNTLHSSLFLVKVLYASIG